MFSEQDVDRELKAALSVSPSADFEARVLRRIAVGRGLKTPALRGARVFLAAAASVVIVAGLFYALNRTPGVQPPTAPQIVDHAPPSRVPPATPQRLMPGHKAPAHKNTSKPPRVETVRASRRAPRTAEPEVIVPMNQMEAVRRLVRAVNEGRITAPTEAVETSTVVLKEVVVAPLTVDPIPVPAVEPAAETPSPIIRGR